MVSLRTLVKGLPILAVCVMAADYPTIPADLTTPVQQRLAINDPNCEFLGWINYYLKLSPSFLDCIILIL